jgi:2-hydroxychromene-2-carboxylate isomerase
VEPSKGNSRVKVEFFFDYASPFSYLADCQIDQVLVELPIDLVRIPVYLLRGSVFLEGRPEASPYMVAAFCATWAEQREVSSAEHAADIAAEVGVDRDEFLAGIAQQSVKDTLKENTEGCIARGGFGVPTFFVGKEMFWGQDRLDQLRRHLE